MIATTKLLKQLVTLQTHSVGCFCAIMNEINGLTNK